MVGAERADDGPVVVRANLEQDSTQGKLDGTGTNLRLNSRRIEASLASSPEPGRSWVRCRRRQTRLLHRRHLRRFGQAQPTRREPPAPRGAKGSGRQTRVFPVRRATSSKRFLRVNLCGTMSKFWKRSCRYPLTIQPRAPSSGVGLLVGQDRGTVWFCSMQRFNWSAAIPATCRPASAP